MFLWNRNFGAMAALACISMPAMAQAADPGHACTLMSDAEIVSLHLMTTGIPASSMRIIKKEESGAPADFLSEYCTFNSGDERQFLSVGVHTFAAPVTQEQLEAWESSSSGADDTYSNVAKGKIGEATCETGQYDNSQADASGKRKPATQYYTACDTLLQNRRRITVNLQVPDDQAALLPVEKLKELLDMAVKRIGPLPAGAPAARVPERAATPT